MGGKIQKRLILTLALAAACVTLAAQNTSEQRDSLVRLVKASSINLEEYRGTHFRKVFDATFLHNDTYLICDTAYWNVEAEIINAWGHVQLIQDETVLTSEKLDYFIDLAKVEFRGGIVELRDKSGNTLRTRTLDYYTRDSLAVFSGGGAMRSQDGQVIESRDGNYDTRAELFTFDVNVNMFTDTVYIKTDHMEYEGGRDRAVFTSPIDFWYDDSMLSADGGWYDRRRELFFFTGRVHATTEDQEMWSDSAYVYREPLRVELMGEAQLHDPTRDVVAYAESIVYEDTLSRVTLTDDAALAMITDKDSDTKRDTLYAAADTFVYRTEMAFRIHPDVMAAAAARKSDIEVDPVGEFRRRAAEEAARAAEEARRAAEENDPNLRNLAAAAARQASLASPVEIPAQEEAIAPEEPEEPGDVPPGESDDEDGGEEPASEEEGKPAVEEPKDSSRIGFFSALGNVRVFRKDIQLRSGRMEYSDLDSIARFYDNPMVWNEGNRQYTSDSLFIQVKDSRMHKANLISNAFIIIQESETLFDQISGTEVMAYFDSTSALKRFDALGNSSAIFFLKEKDALSTVNLVNSKMLSANLVGGELDEVFYFEEPKNNAYPLAQLSMSERTMPGFNWDIRNRPRHRMDITRMEIRESERSAYAMHPRTVFRVTSQLFPGYMEEVQRKVAERNMRRRQSETEPDVLEHEAADIQGEAGIVDRQEGAGTPAVPVPDVAEAGTEGGNAAPVHEEAPATVQDAPGEEQPPEAGTVVETVTGDGGVEEMTPVEPSKSKAELRREEAARRQAVRDSTMAAREAAREAKWARLDSLDAAKAAAREAKKLERKRKATRRALIAQLKREAREQARLERYIRYYEKKKAREAAKKNGKE